MEAYKVVGILSVLALVGCALGSKESFKQERIDGIDLVNLLRSPDKTPEAKNETLHAYPNQELILLFRGRFDQYRVKVFTEMCQLTVAKCTVRNLSGNYEPKPVPDDAEIEKYFRYCTVTKQREYCRDNIDALVLHLMDTIDKDTQNMLTSFVRHYQEREAAVGSAGKAVDGLTDAEAAKAKLLENIYFAYIDFAKEQFGYRSKQRALLQTVYKAARELQDVYKLFDMLGRGDETKVKPKQSLYGAYTLLFTEWERTRQLFDGFIHNVFYNIHKQMPRLSAEYFVEPTFDISMEYTPYPGWER